MRALVILIALYSAFVRTSFAAEASYVSMIDLIANPKQYDGKIVAVTGFLRLEFEGDAIYLHEDDSKHMSTKNGLWIEVPKDLRKDAATYDRKYVTITGTFSAKNKGHLGLWSGSLEKVSDYRVSTTTN